MIFFRNCLLKNKLQQDVFSVLKKNASFVYKLTRDEYENDNEISLSFSLRFCTQRDERLIASISSSTTTITDRKSEKNTRNDDVSTQKIRSCTRCLCRSEILTSLFSPVDDDTVLLTMNKYCFSAKSFPSLLIADAM